MKKTEMFKKNYEFKAVLSNGEFYSGKCIIAFIKKNNYKNKNLLGLAIGTKIGKATKRNYIKRLIRENYKNLEDKMNTGYSIVFLWKKKTDIKMANYANIEKDMKKIFDRAGILSEEQQ